MKFLTIFPILLVLAFPGKFAFTETLDRMGTGKEPPPPANYTCINVNVSGNGAKYHEEYFGIEMSAYCYAETGAVLVGSQLKNVGATGRYYYDTKIATEKVYYPNGKRFFEVRLTCQSNPWAYGVETANCSPIEPATIDLEGVAINPPYPLTAKYMDSSLQAAILAAKDWKSPEELLKGWNPYEQTGGATALSFIAPQNLEMINQNIGFYPFQLEQIASQAKVPTFIYYQVEHLEETPQYVGDIKIPGNHSHWWQPFLVDSMAIVETNPISLNIGIANGPFAGKPGSYRIRARANNYADGFIGGWTGWRYFCLGQPGDSCGQTYIATSGNLPAWEMVIQKFDQTTKVIKTMQAADIIFSTEKDSKRFKLQKQKLFNRLTTKAAKQPAAKKLSARKMAPAQTKIAQPTDAKISLISAKEGKEVIIKLKSSSSEPVKSQLKIQNLTTGKAIWSDMLSLLPGTNTVKIDYKDLDLKFQPKGKRAYQLVIDENAVGKIVLDHGRPLKPTRRQLGTENRKTAGKKFQKMPTAILAPKLKISLSRSSRGELKENDKITIAVKVKNTGKGTLKKSELYSLICKSACPFTKSGSFKKDVKSNGTLTFTLTSKALKAGNYDVTLKTKKYGSSNTLKFEVKKSNVLRRSQTEGARRMR